MLEKMDNILSLLRVTQAANVRLTNENASLVERVRFLEAENSLVEAETREACQVEIDLANHARELAEAKAEAAMKELDAFKRQTEAKSKGDDHWKERALKAEAERDSYAKDVADMKKRMAELEPYRQIADEAVRNHIDAEDAAEALKRQLFGQKSDATRFLKGEIDPDNPDLEDLPFADLYKEVIRKVEENSKTAAASSKDRKKGGRRKTASKKSVKTEAEVKRAKWLRNKFTVDDLQQMGMDTSNLPPNSVLIKRKDKDSGEDIWEVRVYTYTPAKVKCKVYTIGRFNVKGGDPMCSKHPDTIVPKNPLMPSFAAFYLDSKINLGLPENRILDMLNGMKCDMPQASLNKWMHQIMKRLRELLEPKMLDVIRQSNYTNNDGTRILVRSFNEPTLSFKYKTEYIQACLSKQMKTVVMLYREGSRGHSVQEDSIFKDSQIKGFTCDGAPQYKTIQNDLEDMKLIRQACWFHARHYLVDAYLTDKRMGEILILINLLFRIEREFLKEEDKSHEARLRFRQKWSARIANRIMKKLEAIKAAGNEYGGMVHRAVDYILGDKEAYLSFLKDGGIEIHNNAIEACFRHIAVGRRNWQQAGSHEAAQNIAFMFGLLESCKMNGLDFGDYVEDILTRILKKEELDETALPCTYVPRNAKDVVVA